MMITRLNFPYLFPQILTTIQSSNFISLDLEMSGIISSKTLDPSLTDTIQNRYHKTREKVKTFIPLQLGLCAVKIQNNRVKYTPMNFYLYPLSLEERDAQQFSFNSESMRFLSQNHFDFNKLFYEGIPFTNSTKLQKNQIKTSLLKAEQQKTRQYMLQSPDISAFIALKMNEFSNWISSQQNENKDLLIDIQFVRVKAYLYLIQKIVQKYPSISINFSFIDSQGNQVQNGNFLTRKYLKIKRLSNENKSEDSQNPSKIKLQNSPQSLLFLKLWQTITSKQVPLIVHNGFLDLMHIYHRFIDNLPLEQSQFRKSFHAKFPIIYDTKYMCNNSPLIYNKLNRDTSLGNCYKKFLQMREETKVKQQHIDSQLNCEFSGYKFDSQEAHEAGFDALMTAYVFVQGFKQLYYSPLKMIQPNFHKTVQFYCNKVPLGNIRLPFNFASENESYEKDGGTQIFFTCLQRPTNETAPLLIKQQKITGYLLSKYGATRLIWQDRYLCNFVITFIDEKDSASFIRDNLDSSGFGLYELGDSGKYLVSSESLPIKIGETSKK